MARKYYCYDVEYSEPTGERSRAAICATNAHSICSRLKNRGCSYIKATWIPGWVQNNTETINALYIFDGVYQSKHRCSRKQAADMLPAYINEFGCHAGFVIDNDTGEILGDCEITR